MSGILAEMLAPSESRFHVSQTPPGWVKSLVGKETATGVVVNEAKALELTTVFACVRVLSESVASLPLLLYRRLEGGGKARARDHYLYEILHDAPNTEMTSFEFRETLMGHVVLWGNAYAEVEIDGAGRVRALWPLRPDRMRVKRVKGRLRYIYRLKTPDAKGRTEVSLRADQVFHVRGLGFDGIVGYSVIQYAKQAVGLALAAEEFGARFFGNDARPGVILEHPGTLGDEAHKRLRESWESRHGGLDRSHRVAILEEGLSLKEVGLPPEDAQFLQTRRFQVVDICRIFRVPPHMVADLERATFSNIEHQSLEFVIHTLRPWLVRWEQAIDSRLLTARERARYFAEHLVDALLRGDVESRFKAYATGRQWGWLSANDVRRLENMNPVDGGDVYLVPLNMVPADEAGLGGTGMESEAAVTEVATTRGLGADERLAILRHRLMKAHFRTYRDVAARVLRREVNDVGNALRRWMKRRDYGGFSVWLGDFYREHVEFVRRQFSPLAASYGELVAAAAQEEVGEPPGMTPELEEWVEGYLEVFAARHARISEARIRVAAREAMEAGDDALTAIEGELESWEEERAEETARWESVRFGNALAKAVFVLAGIQRVRWVAFGKNCPYCSDLNGKVVGINKFFISAGTEYEPEGADRPLTVSHNVGHPPAHDGCDCTIAAA